MLPEYPQYALKPFRIADLWKNVEKYRSPVSNWSFNKGLTISFLG